MSDADSTDTDGPSTTQTDEVVGQFEDGTTAAEATLFPPPKSTENDQQRRTANGQPVDENDEPVSDAEPDGDTGEDTPTDEPTADSGDAEADTNAGDTDGDDAEPMDPSWFAQETGINADSPEEAARKVNHLKDQNAGYRELQTIIDNSPGFQRMLNAMADGKTAAEAAAELDGVQTQAPDPNENPEAYAEWKAAQKMKEQQAEQQSEQQRERREQIQRKKARIEEEFHNVVEQHEDIDPEALGTTLKRLTVTAPGATFRARDLHVLAKGLKFDEAVEQARKEGREEALQQVRDDGTVKAQDGLPDLHSSGGGASENDEGSGVENAGLFGPTQADMGGIHDRV